MSKLISIIINIEQTIHMEKTLLSIENQSFKDFEVILLVDSDSDKQFKQFLKSYVKSRDKFIIKEYKSLPDDTLNPYNNGLNASSGEYICFLNVNDIYNYNALSIMYEQASKNMADLVICDYNYYTTYDYKSLNLSINNTTYKTSNINNAMPYILNDFYLCNKLFRKQHLIDTGISFTAFNKIARQELIYHTYLSSKKTIAIDAVLIYNNKSLGKELPQMLYKNEISVFVDTVFVYNNITKLYTKYLKDNLNKKEQNAYRKLLLKTRLYALYHELYKYYWFLKPPVKILIRNEILNLKSKFNTAEWIELSHLYCGLPLERLPTNPLEMISFSEVTIAVFGSYLNTVDSVIDTISSFYQNDLVRFNIIVPKYIYILLPRYLRLRKNIQFIDDYGKNSFYSKTLRKAKSRYILFTHGGYSYDFTLSPLFNKIKQGYSDLVTTPIYYYNEDNEKNMLSLSEKGFNPEYKNNFSIDTDDIYDCILPNKLIRVEYLKNLKMTFDGYDFSSALTILNNANIIRYDTNSLIIADKNIEEEKFQYIDINRVRITQQDVNKTFLFTDLIGKNMVQNLLLLRNTMLKENSKISFNYYYSNLNDDEINKTKVYNDFYTLASKCDVIVAAHNLKDFKITTNTKTAFIVPATENVNNRDYDYIFSHDQANLNDIDFYNTGTPISEYVNNLFASNRLKAKFKKNNPSAIRKKIVVISSKSSAFSILKDIDFKLLHDNYVNDYFVVLSMPRALEFLNTINHNLSEFISVFDYDVTYSNKVMICDILITTNVQQAYYASISNKLIYLFTGENNKYVSEINAKPYNNIMENSINLPRAFKEFEKLHGNSLHSTHNIANILINDGVDTNEENY